jgi:FKBP-type peptidyl-prolyl cis-trans isomerase FklB
VEVEAHAVDAAGRMVPADLRWTASDPGMVTVAPVAGDRARVTVHRDGESDLSITAGTFAKTLAVHAKHTGPFLVFEIAPPAPKQAPQTVANGPSPALESRREQVSYAVGLNLARTLQKQSVPIDPDLVRQGFKDALSGGATLMSDDYAHLLLVGIATEINVTDAGLAAKRTAEQNRLEGERFLAANRRQPGVVALPSGLQYKVLTQGQGRIPTIDDVAVCHYRGLFTDGTEFDSSYRKKSPEPVRFPVKGIIKGWQEALLRMPAGSKWDLFIPASLAYGERGAPRSKIGPNTTVVFEVELLSVEAPGTPHPPATAPAANASLPLPAGLIHRLEKAVHQQLEKETPHDPRASDTKTLEARNRDRAHRLELRADDAATAPGSGDDDAVSERTAE